MLTSYLNKADRRGHLENEGGCNVRIECLNTCSTSEMVELWNAAFQDYIVPVTMSEQAFTERMRVLQLTPAASFVAMEEGRFVGICLQAISADGQSAWCGGLAVLPAYRGKGIARSLMEAAIHYCRVQDVRSMYLEVLADNPGAIALYERLGYHRLTELHYFQGELASGQRREPSKWSQTELTDRLEHTTPPRQRLLSIAVQDEAEEGVWKTEDERIPWQARREQTPDRELLILLESNEPIGTISLKHSSGGVAVHQLQLQRPADELLLRSLLALLGERYGDTALSWNHEYVQPELLERIGLQHRFKQYHLKYELH